jgi:hypothetical protein
MKLFKWLSIVCFILATVACKMNHKESSEIQKPLYRDSNTKTRFGDKIRDNIGGKESSLGQGQNEIGFFKYNPKHYYGKKLGPDIIIDRPLLAKHIAHLVTLLPHIEETTALVTDDHVFIGIKTKNNRLESKVIREAKRTAESITPRYFKIHVTHNKTLESKINEIGIRMRGNTGVEGVKGDLEQLLREMGDKTPPDVNESIQPSSRKDVNPDER